MSTDQKTIPQDKLTERLACLKSEHAAGQKMLADLDQRRASLSATLLRIEGAIQVLAELDAALPPMPEAKD